VGSVEAVIDVLNRGIVKRIPSLDGLRAISVSFVLIGHLARAGYTPDALKVYAGSGVRMFFVISGYLITTILLNEHSRTSTINLREFYLRRAYRILPAASTFMLFATVMYWHELRWIDIGAMFTYLVNYDGGGPWMIGHLWSLGVEEQFYLIWPSALNMFHRQRVALLCTAVAFGPIFSAICYYFKVPGGGYTYFPATAGNLAIGCLLAIYGSKIPKISPWIALAMLLAIILIPYYPANTPPRTIVELFVLSPTMNCCMAGLLQHVVQRPYRLLNIAPVVWLGKISYSLYLWQQPFFFAPPGNPPYKLLVAVGLACLSYYFVETPFLKVREKRSMTVNGLV
jgi:peptidoglycan/LPS O-acetylase OafA/YrhL